MYYFDALLCFNFFYRVHEGILFSICTTNFSQPDWKTQFARMDKIEPAIYNHASIKFNKVDNSNHPVWWAMIRHAVADTLSSFYGESGRLTGKRNV